MRIFGLSLIYITYISVQRSSPEQLICSCGSTAAAEDPSSPPSTTLSPSATTHPPRTTCFRSLHLRFPPSQSPRGEGEETELAHSQRICVDHSPPPSPPLHSHIHHPPFISMLTTTNHQRPTTTTTRTTTPLTCKQWFLRQQQRTPVKQKNVSVGGENGGKDMESQQTPESACKKIRR